MAEATPPKKETTIEMTREAIDLLDYVVRRGRRGHVCHCQG